MKNYTRLSAVLLGIFIMLGVWTMAGCQKPEVGEPDYQDPMGDTSTFEPADEFKYLLDIDAAQERVDKIAESGEMPEDLTNMGPADLIASMGAGNIIQKNVTSQASDKLVKVTGEYSLGELGLEDDENPMTYLADLGAAEVVLPNHFPQDRYMGHFFIANPDDLFEELIGGLAEDYDKNMASQDKNKGSSGMDMMMGGDFETGLSMFGIESMDDIYGWMGDELIVFNISNPDYDPEGELGAENTPAFQAFAIAADDPDAGIELVDGMLQSFLFLMLGVQAEEGEIAGHNALIITPPPIEDNPMFEDMDKETLAAMSEISNFAAVSLPGYLMISDQPAIEAIVEAFDPEAAGTGRMAHIESEMNWDIAIDKFSPANPGMLISLIESDEVRELLTKFVARTSELEELGITRFSLLVRDGENFDVELLTSRESIELLEIVREIVEETDEEDWEAIGDQIDEIMEQPGFGAPMGMDM